MAGAWPAWSLAIEGSDLRAGRGVINRRGSARWRSVLVTLQISLATVLLASTWWALGAAGRLSTPLEPLRRDDLVAIQASIFGSPAARDHEKAQLFWQRLESELEALPEVELAAYGPVVGRWGGRGSVEIEGQQDTDLVTAKIPLITSQAFEILQASPIQGRELRPDEFNARDVAIVDRRFADLHLGDTPIGRRVRLDKDKPWRRVVGVVPNLAFDRLAEPVPSVYVPAQSQAGGSRSLVLRTRSDSPVGLERTIRLKTATLDADATLYWVRPMRHFVDLELRHMDAIQASFSVFAAVALLITAAGLYGALSLAVASRKRELAVRQALGAKGAELRQAVILTSLRHVGVGAVVGGLLATWELRILAATFGELVSFGSIVGPTSLTLVAVGILAAWVPAWRAGTVDPVLALNQE